MKRITLYRRLVGSGLATWQILIFIFVAIIDAYVNFFIYIKMWSH